MSPKSYISYTAAVILQTLANGYRHGFDIMDVTGLPSGTVYPSLRRLEDAGLVESRWEKESVARQEQRPARKYYDLTREGKEALEEAVKRYRLLARSAPVPSRKPKPERG
ncbi:MAG: PadR family transcriptional regulator [Acidobacteriota bacterium]